MFAFIIRSSLPTKAAIYIFLLKAPDALDSVCKTLATSYTRRGLTFLEKDRIQRSYLCRPHGQDFFLPTIGVTPKKIIKRLLELAAKEPLQRSD